MASSFKVENDLHGEEPPFEANDTNEKTLFSSKRGKRKIHKCNVCSYTTTKKILLTSHLVSHSEERPYTCSICEKSFKTLIVLENHVNSHNGIKPHKCRYCKSRFTCTGGLSIHVKYKHTNLKSHKCPECDFMCVEMSKLKRHLKCHTGERPFQCPHCTYAGRDRVALSRHLRVHTGERPYECDICHSRFRQRSNLTNHRITHSDDKTIYRCKLCPQTCVTERNLRNHVQNLHYSDLPLPCNKCGFSFPDRHMLKVHLRTHKGEKWYKCHLCSYNSTFKRELKSHMLIHSSVKSFPCNQCDQSFGLKLSLMNHQNLYHNLPNLGQPTVHMKKKHDCLKCGMSFSYKGNFDRHLALHDPESTTLEKNLALKTHELEKIQSSICHGVDSQDLIDDSEEEIKLDEEGLLIKGEDGQDYVILEVTHLLDDVQNTSGGKGVVHLVGAGVDFNNLTTTRGIDTLPSIAEKDCGREKRHKNQSCQDTLRLKKEQERRDCFGFDVEDE